MTHPMYPNYPFPPAATDRYSHAALLEASRYPNAAAAPTGPTAAAPFSGVAPTTIFGPPGAPWPAVSGFGVAPAADPAAISGVKRSAEVFYHQSIMGTDNAIGQSEDLFSTNSFAKHPRLATASVLHNYPQRLGEKDCAHYMLTRTCKFGANCKFNHPAWVPEGGIPSWKEVTASLSDVFPERPGEPDCPYTTQRCTFGSRCKFNHPKITTDASASSVVGELKDLQKPSAGEVIGSMEQHGFVAKHNELVAGDSKPAFTPVLLHNSSGLPIRPGETACAFYLKTGSCKYGAACRYDHPNINSINSQVPASLGQAVIPTQANILPLGVLYAANLVPTVDPFLAQSSIASGQTNYPQRPGEQNCDHYMKFGQCKFGERCKFHHPIERSMPTSCEQNVKLTLAGLPERQGTSACPFYMKTGACKFGVRCKFDHPLGPLPENAKLNLESAAPAVGEDRGTAIANQ